MIGANQGYTWLGVNYVQALFGNIKQGFKTNKEILTFIKSERSSKLKVSIQLVVVTILQVQ
jgi:hypothetical protein